MNDKYDISQNCGGTDDDLVQAIDNPKYVMCITGAIIEQTVA